MDRRTILTLAAAAGIAPVAAQAAGFVTYTPAAIEAALAEGKTVFVDYSATWCGTCKRQARVIDALRASDSKYDANLTFIKVDWDTYKGHDVTTSRNIPRRLTLLMLRGSEELGRLVVGTSEAEISALMEKGL